MSIWCTPCRHSYSVCGKSGHIHFVLSVLLYNLILTLSLRHIHIDTTKLNQTQIWGLPTKNKCLHVFPPFPYGHHRNNSRRVIRLPESQGLQDTRFTSISLFRLWSGRLAYLCYKIFTLLNIKCLNPIS